MKAMMKSFVSMPGPTFKIPPHITCDVNEAKHKELQLLGIKFEPWQSHSNPGQLDLWRLGGIDLHVKQFSTTSLYDWEVFVQFEKNQWSIRFHRKIQFFERFRQSCPEFLKLDPTDTPTEVMNKVDQFLLAADEKWQKLAAFQ